MNCSPDSSGEGERPSSPRRSASEIFLEITDLAVRGSSFLDLFKDLAPRLRELTSCDFVSFSLHDSAQNCMLMHFWEPTQEVAGPGAFPVDDSVSGWVWKHQQELAIPDLDRDSRFPTCLSFLRGHHVRSLLCRPLSTRQHRYGALGLGKGGKEPVDLQHSPFLSRVASMVALALENQETQRVLQEQQQRLQSLMIISQELSSSLDLEQLSSIILANLRQLTTCDWAVVKLLEEDPQYVRMYAANWVPGLELESLLQGGHRRVPYSEATSAQAIETRRITFWSAEELEQLGTPLAKEMREAGTQSLCNVPLMSGGEVLGALNLGSMRKDAFSQHDAEYLQQVANLIASALHNARSYREIDQLKDRLAQEKRYLESEIRSEFRFDDTIGNSTALKHVLDHAAIVANTDSTVLITGETGTGKERIARSIHSMSRRRDRNFIKLNCAAIPTGLLESELFGHEKGAFTGAVSQKVGRLELADKGTLFLDEIGEIPLELQPKLLRVLQDQEFERLGGTRTLRVDIRLISATNRDLFHTVQEKQFRSDLFYRLNVFPLHVPALRERREDIPLLVRYFVEKFAARLNKRIDLIPDEAIGAMLKWNWPGNIRELENFIERSVILSEGNVLRPPLPELRLEILRQQTEDDGTLRQKEREHVIDVLRQTRGVLSGPSGAAARLGLKRTTLQYKMQKLGISRIDYLD